MRSNVIRLARCSVCFQPSLSSVCDYCRTEQELRIGAAWHVRSRKIWAGLVLSVGALALALWWRSATG